LPAFEVIHDLPEKERYIEGGRRRFAEGILDEGRKISKIGAMLDEALTLQGFKEFILMIVAQVGIADTD
jgi:hypothetical protein